MSDEIENLLESSAMVNAKINLLENDLLEERQRNHRYKNNLDDIKQELSASQKILQHQKGNENELHTQIVNLQTDLNNRPTKESFNELKNTCDNLQTLINELREEAKRDDKSLKNDISNSFSDDEERSRFLELEEELVVMKEQYAKSVEDKISMNRTLDKIQKDYNDLTNRSHNVMFFYIAPLVFLVAYLLFTTLVS